MPATSAIPDPFDLRIPATAITVRFYGYGHELSSRQALGSIEKAIEVARIIVGTPFEYRNTHLENTISALTDISGALAPVVNFLVQ